ncbi:lachesin isoform X2 [Eurytemora carolleeae]|uniref:lachesin isoform X2 n=1 Tax=Eurytemora carolleeae TaxID=1294199 RepID=UPI000C76EB2C|nr:lachesin isoform X2 [Eurytemora carolleeae]|eukprot:XP_023320862.1 lachesin-like isoform X2 [Eurytemora affinis]
MTKVFPYLLKNVKAGRSVTLYCSVSGLRNHRVSWIKSDTKAILSLNGQLVTQNSRYQLSIQDPGTFQLTVSNVTVEDNGTYICQVNTEPPANQESTLLVVTSPRFTNTSESVKQVALGITTFLTCEAEGVPRPTVYWKREDDMKMILQDRGEIQKWKGVLLPLAPVTRSSSGKYVCIANNGNPPTIMKTFTVHAMFPPEVAAINSSLGAVRGSGVALGCSIQAYPPPTIHWSRSRGELEGIADTIELSDDLTEARLEIDHVTHATFGLYTCRASNQLGSAEAVVLLKEKFEERVKEPTQSWWENYSTKAQKTCFECMFECVENRSHF